MRTDEVEVTPDVPYEFQANYRGLEYPCSTLPSPGSDVLIVSLSAFTDRDKAPPPWFTARPFYAAGHLLQVFDPTIGLHPTMRISCFLGTESDDAIVGLIEIAERVAHSLDVPNSRVIYWGGSAGGLGAAMAAVRSENGRAIVVNGLLELEPYFNIPGARPILEVFGISQSEVKDRYRHRTSTSAALRKALEEGASPKLVVAQNRLDRGFYTSQYAPFCRAWHLPEEGGVAADGPILSIPFNDPAGHICETAPLLQMILDKALPFFFDEPRRPPAEQHAATSADAVS